MNLIQLQPDDVLVLTVAETLTPAQRAELTREVGKDFGPGRRLVILANGTHMSIVRKIGGDAAQSAPETPEAEDGTWPPAVGDQRTGGVLVDPEAIHEVIPPHVWMYRVMMTEQQRAAHFGRDETNGQYAVAVDQLTDEQRAIPHVADQLAPVGTLELKIQGLV